MKLALSILFVLATLTAQAQKATTPKIGSPERKAIMDALRVPVQKDFKGQKLVFKVENLKVLNGWAFLWGAPTAPNGKELSYKGTKFEEAVKEGFYDNNISALLRKEKGKWKVKVYVVGATDVPWVEWPEQYKAPKSIFPELGG